MRIQEVADAALKLEREGSLKKLDESMEEVKALKKENAAAHEKLKSQGERNQQRNQQLADKWRVAEDNANVSAEKEKLARLRAEAAESKATEQEERVQALSQEVKETREQISKLESADPGDGGDSPDDSSSDESDGDVDDGQAPAAVGLVGGCASSGIVALENSPSQNEESSLRPYPVYRVNNRGRVEPLGRWSPAQMAMAMTG
eukprot:COSAG06_NODE_361_length_16829_cov_8.781112_9_plen_204_part_00